MDVFAAVIHLMQHRNAPSLEGFGSSAWYTREESATALKERGEAGFFILALRASGGPLHGAGYMCPTYGRCKIQEHLTQQAILYVQHKTAPWAGLTVFTPSLNTATVLTRMGTGNWQPTNELRSTRAAMHSLAPVPAPTHKSQTCRPHEDKYHHRCTSSLRIAAARAIPLSINEHRYSASPTAQSKLHSKCLYLGRISVRCVTPRSDALVRVSEHSGKEAPSK